MATKFDMQSLVTKVKSSFKGNERLADKIGTGGVLRTLAEDDFIKLGSWWSDTTGLPGVPKGRITLIGGTEDSGKCISLEHEGMYVVTEKGIQSFKDAFNSKASTISGKEVGNWYLEAEKKPVYEVSFSDGTSIFATENHKLKTLDEKGNFYWRSVKEYYDSLNTFSDEVSLQVIREFPQLPDSTENSIKLELAELLGLIYSCGKVATNNTINFSYASVLQKHRVAQNCFALGITIDSGFTLDIDSLGLAKNNCYTPATLRYENFPKEILSGGKFVIEAFLRGFLCDNLSFSNFFKKKSSPCYHKAFLNKSVFPLFIFLFSCIEIVAEEHTFFSHNHISFMDMLESSNNIFKLLYEEDSVKRFFKYRVENYEKNLLKKKIPFAAKILLEDYYSSPPSPDRTAAWRYLYNLTKSEEGSLSIVSILSSYNKFSFKEETKQKISSLLTLNFKTIDYVDTVGTFSVADPHIPFDNAFNINSIVSHNTSFAIQTIKAAIEQGLGVIYAESEGKTTEKDFKDWGVDPEQVLFVQSAIAEELFELVFAAWEAFKNLYPDSPLLVVIDSLGNVISQRDSTIDLTEQNSMPGGKGKINRLGLNKMIAKSNEDNTTLLLISYTYDNLGSVGQTIAGGKSLALLSTLTYQTQRKAFLERQVQGKKIRYGAEVVWKLRKNHVDKTAPMEKEIIFKITKDGIEPSKGKVKVKESEEPEEEQEN